MSKYRIRLYKGRISQVTYYIPEYKKNWRSFWSPLAGEVESNYTCLHFTEADARDTIERHKQKLLEQEPKVIYVD